MSDITVSFGSEDSFRKRLVLEITNALTTLLGTKHLYQSVVVSSDILAQYVHSTAQLARWEEANRPSLRPKDPEQEELRAFVDAKAFVSRTISVPWQPKHLDGDPPSPLHGDNLALRFELPTIQAHCLTCDARWPFNPGSNSAWHSQRAIAITLAALHEKQAKPPSRSPSARSVIQKSLVEKTPQELVTSILQRSQQAEQVFVFPYQCQQCKGPPIYFLVRRTGLKLTLCGRDPIETVDVPKFLPNRQRKYFSDALVAHHAGQTLAGLFLLRTFIEQFWISLGLSVTAKSKRSTGDELAEGYNQKLPPAFRAQFPSLGDIYRKLSVAIHGASADAMLFETAKSQIVEHFDARRLFKMAIKSE